GSTRSPTASATTPRSRRASRTRPRSSSGAAGRSTSLPPSPEASARRGTRPAHVSGLSGSGQDDAPRLAGLGRRREGTPGDLLEAAIGRVEVRNPRVNAVVMKLYAHGRRAIADGLPDGPFTGVPFLMKDLTASLAGIPMTRGSRFFADAPPPAADSEHV